MHNNCATKVREQRGNNFSRSYAAARHASRRPGTDFAALPLDGGARLEGSGTSQAAVKTSGMTRFGSVTTLLLYESH